MAIFKPGQNTDDVCRYGDVVDDSDVVVYLGYAGISTIGAFRFVNVTIPSGATILTAKVTIQHYGSASGTTVNVRIKGQSDSNPITFSTVADFDARTKTTAFIDWNNLPDMDADTDYDTPDITSIIQEIIGIAGWASGNSLVLFFEDNGSTNYRQPGSYNYSTTVCARLDVTYSIAEGDTGAFFQLF